MNSAFNFISVQVEDTYKIKAQGIYIEVHVYIYVYTGGKPIQHKLSIHTLLARVGNLSILLQKLCKNKIWNIIIDQGQNGHT